MIPPQEAAQLLWDIEKPSVQVLQSKTVGEWAIKRIIEAVCKIEITHPKRFHQLVEEDKNEVRQFQRRLANWAPPRYERPMGPQEAETILCKYLSYIEGHYRLGEDIEAVRKGLLKFPFCKLSQALYKAGRRGGLWK